MSRYKPDRDSIKEALKEDAALRREGYVTPEPVEALVERVREVLELVYREHFAAADGALADLTELAERVKAAEALHLEAVQNWNASIDAREAAERERDELVEALEHLADAIEGALDGEQPWSEFARARIAKVRGEAE